MAFSNLRSRLITAAAIIFPLLSLFFLGQFFAWVKWIFMTLAWLTVLGAAAEFATFSSLAASSMQRRLYFIVNALPASLVFFAALIGTNCALTAIAVKAFMLGFFLTLAYMMYVGRESLETATCVAREIFLVQLILGLCGGLLTALPLHMESLLPLLWVLFVIYLNDAAAYFGGSALGGPKLAVLISPNKTIAGSLAGLLAGILFGSLLYGLLGKAPVLAASLAVPFVLAAQLGDLSKSYIKRLHGVKDTGTLLPGHGGIWDRIDAVLLAAPLLYLI